MSTFKTIALTGGLVAGALVLAFGVATGLDYSAYGTAAQQSVHQQSAENAVTGAGFTNAQVEKVDGGYCMRNAKITHKFTATNPSGLETTAYVCQTPRGMATIVYPPRAK